MKRKRDPQHVSNPLSPNLKHLCTLPWSATLFLADKYHLSESRNVMEIRKFFQTKSDGTRIFPTQTSFWALKQALYPEILESHEFEDDLGKILKENSHRNNDPRTERRERRHLILNWIPSFIEFREHEMWQIRNIINQVEILVVEIKISSMFASIPTKTTTYISGLLDKTTICLASLTCHPMIIRREMMKSLYNSARKRMPYFRGPFKIQLQEPLVCRGADQNKIPKWNHRRHFSGNPSYADKKRIPWKIDEGIFFTLKTLSVWNRKGQVFSSYASIPMKNNQPTIHNFFHARLLLTESQQLTSFTVVIPSEREFFLFQTEVEQMTQVENFFIIMVSGWVNFFLTS